MNHSVQDAIVQDLFAALSNPATYSLDQRGLWHFGAALIVAACTALVVYRERGSRISRFFAAFTTLFVVWALARGLMRLIAAPEPTLYLARWFYALLFLSLPFLYQFTMMLLRIEGRRATAVWLNWGMGVFLALLCVGSPAMIAGVQRFAWGWEPQFGAWGYVALLWITVVMVQVLIDATTVVRRLQAGVERRRIILFCLALALLYPAAVDFAPALGFAVYPWAFVPVSAFTLLAAWLTLRYGLVEVNPQLAAQEIAGLVRGALLILDRDGTIQYCNPFAESVLAHPRATLLGAAAPKLLGEVFQPARLAQLAQMEGREAEQDVLYPLRDGTVRDLALSAVAVRDAQQRDVAFVCLLRDVTEQKRLQGQRHAEGVRDTLTGLPGRPLFLERLDAAVRRAAESKDYDFAVCFIGLDRLKVINEDLGFAAGDRALAEVARRLRKSARAEDTVARLGGDEFGVLLDGTSYERLQGISARLQQVIAAPMRLSDHDVHVSASIGIAGSTFAYGAGAEILRAAGTAMSQAKRNSGGGGVHILTRSERSTQRTKLEAELRQALEARQFQVHYQPVLDLRDKRVAGFEALVRWQHPERGLVMPGAFIELAEQIGLSRQLDLYVMEQACADLAQFQRAANDRQLSLSVNMAEGCLRDAQFTERVGASLTRHRLDPSSVRVEVLERVAMITPLLSTLNRLRALGVGLAVDDFGIGYSSLSRLHELPLTVLKVDREFVQAMAQGPNSEKVIVAILALGGSLGLTVIAEGAGQMREVRRLRDLGCRYIQGFFFSQAVPAEKAMVMVRDPAQSFGGKFAELDAAWVPPTPPGTAPLDPRTAPAAKRTAGRG